MSLQEQLGPQKGIIKDIQPASLHGGEGDDLVALVGMNEETSTAILPLPNPHPFKPGDLITVTPETTIIGKGSLTIFRLDLIDS